MDNPTDPPEIPQEAVLDEGAPGGELLPPGSAAADAPDPEDTAPRFDDIGLDFDDLPDPPGGPHAETPDDPSSLEAVFDVPVKVQAVLGRARMPIAELVSMRPGYVFELDRRVGEAIDILVNDRLIARGEVVMIDGALGVTLTEIVKQDG